MTGPHDLVSWLWDRALTDHLARRKGQGHTSWPCRGAFSRLRPFRRGWQGTPGQDTTKKSTCLGQAEVVFFLMAGRSIKQLVRTAFFAQKGCQNVFKNVKTSLFDHTGTQITPKRPKQAPQRSQGPSLDDFSSYRRSLLAPKMETKLSQKATKTHPKIHAVFVSRFRPLLVTFWLQKWSPN